MPVYAIFNQKTGEIVQLHSQPEELPISREELLNLADATHDKADLDVEPVDPAAVETGRAHRFDVQARKLAPTDVKQVQGFGGARVSAV